MQWGCRSKDAESLASAVETAPDGVVWFRSDTEYDGPGIVRIDPAGADGTTPEEAERKKRIGDIKAAMEEARASRISWFDERIGGLDSMPNVMRIVEDGALAGYEGIGRKVGEYEQAAGAEVSREFCQMLAAYGYARACETMEMNGWMAQFLADGESSCYGKQIESHLMWAAAFEADGHEPGEAAAEVKRLCEAALADDEEKED